MAKKDKQSSAKASTHVTSRPGRHPGKPSSEAIKAGNGTPPAVLPRAADGRLAGAAAEEPRRDPLNQFLVGAVKVLGSLQLAVVLLSIFATVVFLGVVVEHHYKTKIAQDLVYQAWWFNLLLFLLAINIFFAAAKKWPFRQHQTGFIITHIGLITMLVGGIFNGIGGIDAQMILLDTSDRQIQDEVARRMGRVPHQSGSIAYSDTAQIRAVRADAEGQPAESFETDFSPGALPWRAEGAGGRTDWFISTLNWLQSPLGRWQQVALDKGATLDVLNYYPLAQREVFQPAGDKDDKTTTAFKLQFSSKRLGGDLDEEWLGGVGSYRTSSDGMGLTQKTFLGDCAPGLVGEFLKPRPPAEVGEQGVLTVLVQGEAKDIPVAGAGKRPVPLGDSGLSLEILEHLEVHGQHAVVFQLRRAGGPVLGEYVVTEFFPGDAKVPPRQEFGGPGAPTPSVWYHAPAKAAQGTRGIVEFVHGGDGRLYFRSFTRDAKNQLALERSGEVDLKEFKEQPVWDGMGGSFRVLKFLPEAVQKVTYLPVRIAPGQETEMDKMKYSSVIHCRLTAGNDRQEVWVPKDTVRPVEVQVGGRRYGVQYTYKQKDIGFELKLERAEQTSDPGTNSPATYTSYVQLYDEDKGIHGEHKVITMNQPLEYRGYTFYQSEYRDLQVQDTQGRPVSYSGFTVARDPGLGLKYRGSILLGLGIAIMFYMRAYFFKPLRKNAAGEGPAEPAPAGNRLGEWILMAMSAAILLIYLWAIVHNIGTPRLDVGQVFDLFAAAAVLYCIWVGMGWARWVAVLTGLVGGALHLYAGVTGSVPFEVITGAAYLAFAACLLFVPSVKAFLHAQMYRFRLRVA